MQDEEDFGDVPAGAIEYLAGILFGLTAIMVAVYFTLIEP